MSERIPKTFAEFYNHKPDFVRQVILKERWDDYDHAPDLEQHLLWQLLHKQAVEKFNPAIYGDNLTPNLFYGYVKEVLRRCYLTTIVPNKGPKRSINTGTVSLSDPLQDGNPATIADVLDDDARAMRAAIAGTELDNLTTYIAKREPSLTPVMDAIRQLGTTNNRELAEYLGWTTSKMTMAMAKFKRLVQSWQNK